jgi:hypothetical protein
MNVFEDEEGPAFNYTTGFWLAGFPEIIIFAMKPEIASDIMWELYRSQKSGQSYPEATITNEIFANLPACLLPVSKKHFRNILAGAGGSMVATHFLAFNSSGRTGRVIFRGIRIFLPNSTVFSLI